MRGLLMRGLLMFSLTMNVDDNIVILWFLTLIW